MRSSTAKKSSTGRELEQALAELAALEDFGFERDGASGRREDEALADGDFAAGADERAPLIVAGGFGEHDFDAAGGLFAFAAKSAARVEARGNDAAVVEDEQIAGAQVRAKAGEKVVVQAPVSAVHDQHAAGAALGGRLLRDQLFGQIVVEVRRHGAPHFYPLEQSLFRHRHFPKVGERA